MQSSWKWYSPDLFCLANIGFSFLLSLSRKDSILLTVHCFASPELMISWVFQMHHHSSRKPGFLWDLHIRILSINILYLRGNPSMSRKLHITPCSTMLRLLPQMGLMGWWGSTFLAGVGWTAPYKVLKISMLSTNHDLTHDDTSFKSMIIPWHDDPCAWTNW